MRVGSFLSALALACVATSSLYAQKQPYEIGTSPEGRAYAKGHLLVGFKSGASLPQLRKGASLFGGKVEIVYDQINAALIVYPDSSDVFSLVKLVGSNPAVRYAEPDYIVYADFTPNDTYWVSQQWGPKKINCQAAWDIGTGDTGTVVAIVDTGIDYNHPDLSGKVVLGYDYINNDADPMDDHGHGTHCAGIAAAKTNNATGVAGVGFNCKLMAVKVLNSGGSGSFSAVASGISYATANGAKVISLSLGSTGGDATTQAAIDNAWNNGVVVCAAAGNNGSSSPFYPAYYANCIAVGATDSSDNRAGFSNYGPSWVDVGAPGDTIYSTYAGSYANLSGTSMACPHVAGACGLLYSKISATRNLANATQVRSTLQNNCDAILTSYFAFGRINIGKAMQNIGPPPTEDTYNAQTIVSTIGSGTGGGPASLVSDDNNTYDHFSGVTATAFFGEIVIQSFGADFYVEFDVGSSVKLSGAVDLRALGTLATRLDVKVYNFAASRWDNALKGSTLPTVETPFTINIPGYGQDFVSGTNKVRVRILTGSGFSHTVKVDQMKLRMTHY